MRGWKNLTALKPWVKLGYKLELEHPVVSVGGIYRVIAWAPRCTQYRLDIVLYRNRVAAVVAHRAPATKRHRLWREIEGTKGIDWSKVPAAWFCRKVSTRLQEEAA